MKILIGGSSSTGSSLLRRILNRHSELLCGPETSLFCKEKLFSNWNKSKSKILKTGILGIKNNSWLHYTATDLIKEEYNINEKQITQFIKQSDSLESFCKLFFHGLLSKSQKKSWLEKTPSNSFNFDKFLNQFDNSRVIHTCRNPLDTVSSMVLRGKSVYDAVSLYLLNVAYALKNEKSNNYLAIKYEDLINDSKETLKHVCKFLEVAFEKEMLESNDPVYGDEPTHIKGWSFNENEAINKHKIRKFDQLTDEKKSLVMTAFKHIQLKPKFVEKQKLNVIDINQITKRLGYKSIKFTHSDAKSIKIIRIQKKQDLFYRLRKNAYFGYLNYPIQIK